jgi:thymidylate kinase
MLIVLEGIDGAGKGKQRLEVVKLLQSKIKKLNTFEFPNHQSPIYKHIIHPALHEEIKLNSASWFLSFALDQILQSDIISDAVKSKTSYCIVDGYFTTTIAYQCIMNKSYSVKQALDFAKQFGIPKPDISIFIDADPVIAQKRKMIEEGHDEGMDIFERSLEKQKKIRSAFLKMAKNSTLSKWLIVDGNGSIEEVTQNIMQTLKKHKLI